MSYEKQTWVDGETPLDAEHLNHMEEGIAASVPKNQGVGVAGKYLIVGEDGNVTVESAWVGSSTRNQHNPDEDEKGKMIDADGNLVSNAAYSRTGYIACRTGQKIVVSMNSDDNTTMILFRAIEYFDKDFNRISFVSSSNCGDEQLTTINQRRGFVKENTVDGCEYVRICYQSNRAETDTFMVEIISATDIAIVKPYEPYVKGSDKGEDEYWANKTILWNGDSIPAGYIPYDNSAKIAYPTMVSSSLKAVAVNYAIGGSSLAVQEGNEALRTPLIDRYSEMQDDADLVVIAIGTNDWSYSHVALGDMSSDTKYTFYGAMKLLCKGLLEKYLGVPILFLTPIKRWGGLSNSEPKYYEENDHGNTLKDFASAIKEVCEYYGIPVLDMYSECIINPIIPDSATKYMPDGTHPNFDGHRVPARRITGYIRQLADGKY